MVDYYAELSIDSSMKLDEINKELNKLKSIWRRRELNSPEKAAKIIAMIIDAKEVFKSMQNRSAYDRELAASKAPTAPADPQSAGRTEALKWFNDAKKYYDSGEYDIAKLAVEKVLSSDMYEITSQAYKLAANIHLAQMDYKKALNYINNAIIENPQDADNYRIKALILDGENETYNNNSNNLRLYEKQASEILKVIENGISIAETYGDDLAKGDLMGMYSFLLYFRAEDFEQGEAVAREALLLSPEDPNARKVYEEGVVKRHEALTEKINQIYADYQGTCRMLSGMFSKKHKIAAAERAIQKLMEIEDCKEKAEIIEILKGDINNYWGI